MSRIAVTGANGFVGRALSRALLGQGHSVTGLVRHSGTCIDGVREFVAVGDAFEGVDSNWPRAFEADVVVHLAARVHKRHDLRDPLAAFRATNVDGALRVARAAVRNRASRMVYVSSVKAMGDGDPGRPLREDDAAMPSDVYGQTKREAELALVRFGKESGLDVVIVRPPLVYGPGVRANFFALMRAIARGIPLPLGAIPARRSLVYIDNLADALVHCAIDANAEGQCFHVTDGDDLTVTELVQRIGRHLQQPARLVPIPPSWLRLVGRVSGRTAQMDRLIGSFRVDSARIRAVLGWRPIFSIDEGLASTAHWYRSTR